jgi:hypothetical protein
MSGIISTGSFAKALWPGVKTWYGQTYDQYPVEWSQIFSQNTSKRQFEEEVGVSGFGLAVVKSEGAPVQYDVARQGFTVRYQHVVYGLGFIVTREAFDDDQYDVVGKQKATSLAFSMRQTKEIVGANILNRAFNTSYVGGDGASLIGSAGGGGSASHPNVSGGTYTNGVATAVDLSEAALEQASVDIQAFTNDRGLKIAVMPKALIIPPALEFEAARILKSDGRVGTDNNDMNVLKTLGTIPKVIKNHFLTLGNGVWFVQTNVADGLKYFERRADSFDMDNDWDTENAKFKATGRYSFGWTDPRCIYGSPGA